MLKGVLKHFTTTVFVRGAYAKRYGSMLDSWRSQYAGGCIHHPKDLLGAVDLMRLHRSDGKKEKKTPRRQENSTNNDEGKNATSFAQRSSERRCFACCSREHVLTTCRHKTTLLKINGLIGQIAN